MLLAICLSLADSFSFSPLLELLLNSLQDLRNEKVFVRTICERDETFNTCPPLRLIRDGSVRSVDVETVLSLSEKIVLEIARGCL